MDDNFLKSIVHNLGVVLVGCVVAFIGRRLDIYFGLPSFSSLGWMLTGLLLVVIGFFIRVWAAYIFYQHKMRVIVLHPQKELITTGPYRFSRNPLYLGGNVFIFWGAVFFVGTYMGIALTMLAILLTDRMIRREEKQLEKKFGSEWIQYKKRVRRWM